MQNMQNRKLIRCIAMGKSNGRRKIAVILASMSVEYVSETLRGIMEETQNYQTDVYIFNAEAGTDETLKHNIGEYNIYKLVDYSVFDGVILFANLIQGYSVYSSVIEQIRKSGVVAVSIDSEIEGFYFVGVENYKPMKAIVEHLIEHHKFTKINYVSGQDFNSDSRERLQAYCDALREHGIAVEEKRIFKGAFTNLHGREAAVKMLETPQTMPEAVVCASDSIAIGVRSVFGGYGLKMPQQVVLTGFDNIFEARNSMPPLTTVSRNQDLVGHEAVRRIEKLLDGGTVPKKERFAATPIFRESCGCCNEEEEDITSLRNKYLGKAEHYDRYLFDNIMMIEELNDSKSFADFLERLKPHVAGLGCERFYLCLDKKLVEDLQFADAESGEGLFHDNYQVEGFPRIMTVALAYENGRFLQGGEFPSARMLPGGCEAEGATHNYVFSPIHFRDRCMGYTVADNSKFVMSSPLFGTWLINLSNGLESLRKRAHLKNMVERLDRMYVLDSLTGLYNRFGFIRYAGESFERCIGQEHSAMVLFADLDGLKQINDRFGHDNGDAAILAVAHALQGACRGGEICARIGGDEFIVYAESYTDEDAAAYCHKLEELMAEVNRDMARGYQVSASYGYHVFFPKEGDTVDRYINMADDKMYSNKKKKKNMRT